MTAAVIVDRQAGFHVLSLNRPERLNAFDEDIHLALAAALADAEADQTCRAILLTGEGKAFCAGQNLAVRFPTPDSPAPDAGAGLDKFYNPLIRRIRASPLPVVCAVNGVAAGAGAALALACDIVIAARPARFILSFIRIGLGPDSGASWTVPHLIGLPRARAMALLGEPVDAETAAAWGMIWKCTAVEDLRREATALCEQLASLPSEALAATKRLYDASATNDLSTQLDLERDTQTTLARHPDYREGVRAFKEKRTPGFMPRQGAR
jgi:2-(1,2-epoxy-1,2-dihydrophenyl)acetyl-CoA isomerase